MEVFAPGVAMTAGAGAGAGTGTGAAAAGDGGSCCGCACAWPSDNHMFFDSNAASCSSSARSCC